MSTSITGLKTIAHELTSTKSLTEIKAWCALVGLTKCDFRCKASWQMVADTATVALHREMKKLSSRDAYDQMQSSGLNIYAEDFVGNYSCKIRGYQSELQAHFYVNSQLWELYIGRNASRSSRSAKNIQDLVAGMGLIKVAVAV